MRNLKFVLVALLATVFCACSSDDDNNNGSNALEGTTWESTEEWNGTVYATWVLKFQSSTFDLNFSSDEDEDGKFDRFEKISGSYKIDGKNVSVLADGATMTGTISGNTIHFPETDESDEFTFHKK